MFFFIQCGAHNLFVNVWTYAPNKFAHLNFRWELHCFPKSPIKDRSVIKTTDHPLEANCTCLKAKCNGRFLLVLPQPFRSVNHDILQLGGIETNPSTTVWIWWMCPPHSFCLPPSSLCQFIQRLEIPSGKFSINSLRFCCLYFILEKNSKWLETVVKPQLGTDAFCDNLL